MGATLDIPVHHIKAMLVRSHFDAVDDPVPDAPGADELLLALAVTNGGRPVRAGRRPAGEPTPSARTASTESAGLAMRTLITGIGQIVSGDLDSPVARRRLDPDRRRADRGHRAGPRRTVPTSSSTRTARPSCPGSDRLACPPGLRRLHAAPAHHRLHRVVAPRRRDDDDLGRRGRICPGRPKDIVGLKALAIAVDQGYANFRPGRRQGPRRRADPRARPRRGGLRRDGRRPASRLIGEIGLGSVKTGADAAPMVRLGAGARDDLTFHTGGPSIAGLECRSPPTPSWRRSPHIAGHINGGTTSMSRGGHRAARRRRAGDRARDRALRQRPHGARTRCGRPRDAGALGRVILGNDAPSGTGVVAARHPADSSPTSRRSAVSRRRPRSPGDRQHGPGPRPRCRGARRRAARPTCARATRRSDPSAATALDALAERRPARDLDGPDRRRAGRSAAAGTRRRPPARPRSSTGPAVGGGGH